MITSQTRKHQATEPTMKNSLSNSLLTLKCELLFQMTEQSYLSLFTMRIGFIPISIKRHFRNFDFKPMSIVKNRHKQLVLFRDYFSNNLEQHDEKTLFANCLIEVHMVNMIKNQSLTGAQVINFALY